MTKPKSVDEVVKNIIHYSHCYMGNPINDEVKAHPEKMYKVMEEQIKQEIVGLLERLETSMKKFVCLNKAQRFSIEQLCSRCKYRGTKEGTKQDLCNWKDVKQTFAELKGGVR